MTDHNQERAQFEADYLRLTGSRAGHFDAEEGAFVSPSLQLKYDIWLSARAQQHASVAVSEGAQLHVKDALLMWNRRHEQPPIKIGLEYGVAQALMSILAAAPHPVSGEQEPVVSFPKWKDWNMRSAMRKAAPDIPGDRLDQILAIALEAHRNQKQGREE